MLGGPFQPWDWKVLCLVAITPGQPFLGTEFGAGGWGWGRDGEQLSGLAGQSLGLCPSDSGGDALAGLGLAE